MRKDLDKPIQTLPGFWQTGEAFSNSTALQSICNSMCGRLEARTGKEALAERGTGLSQAGGLAGTHPRPYCAGHQAETHSACLSHAPRLINWLVIYFWALTVLTLLFSLTNKGSFLIKIKWPPFSLAKTDRDLKITKQVEQVHLRSDYCGVTLLLFF